MAPQGDAYHIDWIFSNTSNRHVANHKDWFTKLVDFKSSYNAAPMFGDGSGIEVLGVGDVELEVKTSSTRKGRSSHRKLVLRDVLYAPKAICNIFAGAATEEGYGMSFQPGGGYLTDPKTGACVGLLVHHALMKLWLAGSSKSKSSLNPKEHYYIHATWPAAEEARWRSYKLQNDQAASKSAVATSHAALGTNNVPAYSTAEKAWLKRAFGGEYKFLRLYSLDIHDESERAEGRNIARAMIEADADDVDGSSIEKDEGDNDDEDEDEEEDQFLRDLEEDPMSHLADHFFDDKQLDWIEKHYRHSGNFLISYGLKAFDDEDCREGVAIAEACMEDSEDDDDD